MQQMTPCKHTTCVYLFLQNPELTWKMTWFTYEEVGEQRRIFYGLHFTISPRIPHNLDMKVSISF